MNTPADTYGVSDVQRVSEIVRRLLQDIRPALDALARTMADLARALSPWVRALAVTLEGSEMGTNCMPGKDARVSFDGQPWHDLEWTMTGTWDVETTNFEDCGLPKHAPQSPPIELRSIARWNERMRNWEIVRMRDLRTGDEFQCLDEDGFYRATEDGRDARIGDIPGYTPKCGEGFVTAVPCPDPTVGGSNSHDPLQRLRHALDNSTPLIVRPGEGKGGWGYPPFLPPELFSPRGGPYGQNVIAGEFHTKGTFAVGTPLAISTTKPSGDEVAFAAVVVQVKRSTCGPDFVRVEYESRGDVTITDSRGNTTVIS